MIVRVELTCTDCGERTSENEFGMSICCHADLDRVDVDYPDERERHVHRGRQYQYPFGD